MGSSATSLSPESAPTASQPKSDGRRRDIDGEIIESPDPDLYEYLGEHATKCIACKAPKYCKLHAKQGVVVYPKKVDATLPPVRRRA